ncbi:hypothetical protein [Phenylobacterium conjunctum]|uniref:Uncharacterized protein n=1 Tax=Phenylobacterium conjunctum TaxID=1298959 RepID=A0ABW3T0J1_9CAUL
MPHIHALAVAAWALIPLFAWADRTVGGAGRRSLAFGLVLLAGVVLWALSRDLTPVSMALVWIGYRSLPWKVGGSTTPRGPGQVARALMRHAWPAAIAAVMHYAGAASSALVLHLASYALVATGLAVFYAHRVDVLAARGEAEDGRLNAFIEGIRGAAFGAALAFALSASLGGAG